MKTFICFFLGACLSPLIIFGDEPASFDALATEYERDVRPLLKRFCLDCHSSEKKKGDLDLQQFATLAEVRRGTKVWLKVIEMLDNREMPPEDSEQPSPEQQKKLRGWVERYLHAEALASAGDPGPVVLRRLTNAEYTYTIRDLTGIDLDPAREFPTEGAAGEGFTNAGNALVMSPGLLRKYLDAGKEIAAHAVLLPDGFRFSPNTTGRDWTDEVLAEIRAFYGEFSVVERLADHYGHGMSHLGNAGRLPLEKYFAATLAARDSLSTGDKTIEAVAAEYRLNAKYLGILWSKLTADDRSLLLDDLRSRWRSAKPEDAAALAAHVATWQRGLWTFNPVGLLGRKESRSRWMEPVSPLLTQQELRFKIPAPKDGEEAKEFVVSLVAGDAGDDSEHDFVVWTQPRLVAEGKPDTLLRDWVAADGTAIDAASVCVRAPSVITIRVPADLAGRELVTTASLELEIGAEASVQADVVAGTPDAKSGLLPSEVHVKFEHVNIGADKRTVSYRRPILVAEKSEARKRFEATMGDFRSLFPAALCYTQIVPVDELLTLTLLYREDDHLARLMLDDDQAAQLDKLWEELRYVSREPLRVVDVLDSLLETTIDHPQSGIFDDAVKSFNERADAFRKKLVKSESKHVEALVAFTARAWRRPISETEEAELRELYRRLRELELPREDAFRLTLARVFVASPFLYRLEEAPEAAATVSNLELASRLSYFLWSSMPDEELRAAAESGRLTRSRRRGGVKADDEVSLASGNGLNDELLRQTRRMLKDVRVRRLATEFACQWLHIHHFDPLEQKSEKHFPEFAALRGDMYEESILFFTDLFQSDGSLLSLLNADHTFVNERLAKFYGMSFNPLPQARENAQSAVGTPLASGNGLNDGWRRIDGIQQHGRGGILGLATTLAKQSGATRTSPILRGNWISEVLLGEKLPKPPKNVPQLADTIPEGLTERQLIERHSSDAACAKCHARIDPFGFALESFDAIGRRRENNAAGLAIDSRTTLPDGAQVEGLPGLRDYLLEKRRDAFLRQFCRKLLGYAIGRELQLSDEPLLDEIMVRLAENDYRFSVAAETIVLSKQFRMIRGSNAYSDASSSGGN
ncbi:MAG: hypothetical protein CMJ64_21105 [Planctomycetaceae bacterium]|nr:hypothetical protein [Planctomycetaceae bacterium]